MPMKHPSGSVHCASLVLRGKNKVTVMNRSRKEKLKHKDVPGRAQQMRGELTGDPGIHQTLTNQQNRTSCQDA